MYKLPDKTKICLSANTHSSGCSKSLSVHLALEMNPKYKSLKIQKFENTKVWMMGDIFGSYYADAPATDKI